MSVLEEAFASGKLMRGGESFVDLVEGLRDWCMGAAVPAWMPETDHLVFLLVDGMGDHLLSKLAPTSFLASHRVAQLSAVFPSTTTVALATLATAARPCEHGMPGWWTYLPSRDLATIPLPFCERFGQQPLTLERSEMWPLTPWLETVPAEVLVVSPLAFWDSVFSRYLRGYRAGAPYRHIEQCAELVKAHQRAHSRTFTLLYWPEFDLACHSYGCAASATRDVLRHIDVTVSDLVARLGPQASLLVSADHGLLDIKPEGQLVVRRGEPLLECLRTPPGGEPRTPVFHLKPGREAEFRALFMQRFEGQFVLHTPEQLSDLLGGPLSSLARERYGDLVAVAVSDVVLHYRGSEGSKPGFIGYHGGLTPAEMAIPLICVSR